MFSDWRTVLFKLKPGVSQEQIDGFCEAGRQMVGKVPGITFSMTFLFQALELRITPTGLRDFQVGPALAVTAHRAKGYDMGVVAILENVEDMPGYGLHPAHREY